MKHLRGFLHDKNLVICMICYIFKQKFNINHKNKNNYYFCIDMLIYQAYNKNIQKDEEEWHYGYF